MKPLFLYICLLSLLFSGCMTKKEETIETPSVLKRTPFFPSPDSTITVEQMRKWLTCNPRLDSLSYIYIDSFKTEDAELRLGYQRNFISQQDIICVQQGLTGGYEEYTWILRNSGNRKNKPILKSLNLTTF